MAYKIFETNGGHRRNFVADAETIEAARVYLRDRYDTADVFVCEVDPSPVDDAADCFIAYSGTSKSMIFAIEPQKG